jgi:hypothetical protein
MTFLSVIGGLGGLEVIVASPASPASETPRACIATAKTVSGGTIPTTSWKGQNRRSSFAFAAALMAGAGSKAVAAQRLFSPLIQCITIATVRARRLYLSPCRGLRMAHVFRSPLGVHVRVMRGDETKD